MPRKTRRKYKYEYYKVEVPEDVGDLEERSRVAFIAAEERTNIYATPVVWDVIKVEGDIITVRRIRYA